MTRYARPHHGQLRAHAQTQRRVERQPNQPRHLASQRPGREAPQAGLSPAAVSALLAPDATLQPGTGNGRIARELTAQPQSRRPPAGAGNGARMIYMAPMVITTRNPDEPPADALAVSYRVDALDAASDAERGAEGTIPVDEEAAAQQPSTAPQDVASRVAARRLAGIEEEGEGEEESEALASRELESEAAAQDEAAEEVAEEDAAVEMAPEVIEMEPEVIEARAPARARGGGGGGGDPRAVVQRWQSGVTQGGSAMTRPTMAAVSGSPRRITEAAEQAGGAQQGVREGLPEEAAANIEEPPEIEEPPAPPASDPIPEHTSAILAASDKRLPDAQLPVFVPTPVRDVLQGQQVGGNWPQLGQHPVPNNLFELALSPEREALAEIPADENDRERRQLARARELLAEPLQPGEQMAEGAAAPLVDEGPARIPPLPEGMATPVAAVVTRLLASMDSATTDVMSLLRRLVYPTSKVGKYYPDLGEAALKGQIRERMGTDLREIAAAAGVSGEELDGMVDERKTELEQAAADTQEEISTAHEAATECVGESGQDTLNAIEGVRQATDEEIVSKQEASSGGNDPTVINARRDLVIRWIRNHVTTQTTNYQKAGEKRERELQTGQQERIDAYNALAQREEYQALNPPPPRVPHDRTQPDVARTLSDLSAAIRAWARDRIREVRAFISPFLVGARDTTRENRAAIEKAGNAGIGAARIWAEDRILEGQSWWERFKATLGRWFGDSQEANEQWSVRRTEETRDAIAGDLTNIGGIQAAVAQGATREQLLQTQGLTGEQRALIIEYFEQPPGTHPLDFAATLLRRRLASQYVEVARPAFETELLGKPDEDYPNLTDIARSNNPGFNAEQVSRTIHAQLDNFDSDEATMLRSLEGLSGFEGSIVRKAYRAMWGIDLDFAMSQAFDSDEMDQARLRLEGNQSAADAAALDYAMGLISTDEKAVMDLLRSKSPEEIEQIRAEYRRRYNKELDVALEEGLDEGNEQDQAAALIRGDTETADAIAIDEAMRGGTGWGTDQEDIEATYKRVHDEVLALARNEGWSSEQFQAEVRRRTRGIEARFETRYANVEEYNEPGTEGETVLRRAISSEMWPGPERDLANALASNNQIAADAARIEIERQGLWASDEKINNVLTNQYEHALEETRLDQGPARQMRVARLRAELMRREPPPNEEELSVEIMALERRMEGEMADEAQRRSHISMEALEQAYQGSYFYPLSYTLEVSMSGADREKAHALREQGGRLTALQTVEFATQDDGTDEDALRTRLGSMTKDEIAQLRRDWEARHPGESFDDMLRGELGGRDESDVMDMVEHGAPESASERIDQERRRMQRELGELTGALGGVAAGREEDIIRRNMARLDELEPDLYRDDLSPEERRELREDLDFRIELVQQSVEDHRRAIDSVANLAAQVASMVVAITVGAILTAVSGGALGPVMIAVIASVAATITTMGTKALIQGGSYSGEDMGIDLAIGVVDALTAAATAGMGGRILRGVTGVAQQAARPTQVTRLLGNLGRTGIAQRVARSRAGQVVGRAAARANQAQSGFLTRGIQGQNVLARMARGDNRALRVLAEGLAEGIENAAGALPSAFAGTALNDQTWKGDPLSNLFVGTATGVGMGVGMGAGMQGLRGLRGPMRTHARPSTPEARIAEANNILNDAFQQHRSNNPEANYRDFLETPAGQRARAEVDQLGRLGEAETAREPRPAEAAPEREAVPARVDEGVPTRVDEAAPVRIDESAPPRVDEQAPVHADEIGLPAADAPRAAQMPPADASVPHSEARVTPDTPAPRAEGPAPRADAPEGSVRAADTEAPAPREPGEAAPVTRPEDATATVEAARTGESADGTPSRSAADDPATQALRDALPKALTDRVDVRVNPDLEGNTVRVLPDPHGGPRRGVRVEAGPDATPTDVLMHAHTVQSMQRYRGILGRLRQLRDWFYLTSVGSRGWEAKLELEKLPGLVHERMQQLAKGDLDIDAQVRLMDEINHLSRQIDMHQRILETPELRDAPGRGFVAADAGPKKIRGVSEERPPRTAESMDTLPARLVTNSTLNDEGLTVYQIGHEWQERGRVYRRVAVSGADGNIAHVREEIQQIDDVTGRRKDRWGKRGKESQGKLGAGAVGEKASSITVKEGAFEGIVDVHGTADEAAAKAAAGDRRIPIDESHLRNASDNGFDGAFLRFDEDGGVTMVLVEAKNQPSGLTLNSFSAVRGERLQKNIDDLVAKLRKRPCPIKDLTPPQRRLALEALTGEKPRIEVQVHTTPETNLGHRDHPGSSILKNLEAEANLNREEGEIRFVHVPLTSAVTKRAELEIGARDAIGKPFQRLKALAGEGTDENSLQHRQAQSVLLAEGVFTSGLAQRIGPNQFVDEAKMPFTVLAPGFNGGRPRAKTVATDVLAKLRAPAPLSAVGPGKVILDLSRLPEATQREVLRLLAHDPKAAALLPNLLIHDRVNSELKVFDPDEHR